MSIHQLDFTLNSDFFGLSIPAFLELRTDVRPVSNEPNARYEEYVVAYRLVVNDMQVRLGLPEQKIQALLREYLDTANLIVSGVPT